MILYNKSGKEININENHEINRGGEGYIVKIDNKYVAKIYLPNIQPITENKFNILKSINQPEFIKPEILLYDKNGNIKGYIMKLVDSSYYPLFSIFTSTFCQKNNIDDKLKLKLCEKLINSIDNLHKNDIIIGDLNPLNILINNDGDYYFIDVDSYKVENENHSGRLLDDIRDYLYHGKITKDSDYFSLSVLIFNIFTYIHPFKGVHMKYKTIAERMIHKIPVFKNDKDLKIPKCYVPLSDDFLQDQFNDIFLNGKRFKIELKPTIKITKQKVQTRKIINNLIMTDILISSDIKYIQTSDNILTIHTNLETSIYDVSYKGIYKKLNSFNKSEIYLTNDHYFIKENNSFKMFDLKGNEKIISNFKFNNPLFIKQYENILVVIEENLMHKIYLNQFLSNQIKIESKDIFGYSFKLNTGLYQNISGNSYGFYNKNDILNQIKFKEKIIDIFQINDVGSIQYLENEKIKYKLFKINGLNVETNYEINNLKNISSKDNLIFVPEDEYLSILRKEDFSEIVKYECDLIDEYTNIFNTKSGIIIQNNDGVYLLNTK